MMRRSTVALGLWGCGGGPYSAKVLQMTSGRRNYNNVLEQPYYLKPSSENPYFGTVHDGVTAEFGKGFSIKPIHHLYRFTHNILPLNIPKDNLRPSLRKRLHWLESTSAYRCKVDYLCFEGVSIWCLVVFMMSVVTYHMLRVAFYHPDITWYNLAFPTNKNFVPFVRFNQKHDLDQPVYRYLQQQTEFYYKDAHKRANIELDLIHNDPFINHVKAIGRGDELLMTSSSRFGTPAKRDLIPSVFEEKSEWWTPRAERAHANPDKDFVEVNQNTKAPWSLYTNLKQM